MSKENILLGRQGEDEAVRFLKRKGYKILARNYRTMSAEIDIIARDKDTFCFVEVKTRLSGWFGEPAEAIDRRKQGKIYRAATLFLKEKGLLDAGARFDVVSVSPFQGSWKTELLKNAFEIQEI
ncbi:MAG: YraN family protein [Candidatus Omnitrophica bacterium]|nr:YraN family protein [Candidatus Omnitrophota bacterium]MDD5079815.1 YraN family protein [Candidatus Omnitrophota bacterium]